MNKNSKYFVQYFCRNRIWCKIWSQSWQRRLWAYRKNIFRGIQREYLPDWSNRTIQRAYRLLSGTCSGRSDIPDQGNRSIRIIPIESKWSAPSAWANVVMVWAALPQNWKKRSWLLSHYLYSWRIFSGFRGEYFTLFYICSASGMTGTDVRAGSCGYLLNQQTLVRFANVTIL